MRLKEHLYCIDQECLLLYKSLVFKCVQKVHGPSGVGTKKESKRT